MTIARSELVAALSELPERELVEVIYQVFRPLNEDRNYPNGEFEYDRWCLAQSTFGRFRGETDAAAHIEVVALPAPEYEHIGWKHLCQQGQCEHCKSIIISVSKLALCPVCSQKVECT